MTAHPDRAWVVQQARNFLLHAGEQPDKPEYLLRDHDGKFVPKFDELLRSEGIEVKRVGPFAPNLNAYAERWVQTVRHECLDRFVVFGEDHLRHLVGEFAAYYNRARPQQALGNVPLSKCEPSAAGGVVVCEERLGGLLRHYTRQAA
jgi:putative transposase